MKAKTKCPHCQSENTKKVGFFVRKRTRRKVQRFKCLSCSKSFSSQTTSLTYRQKRPDLNSEILENISVGVGIRKSATNLRTTTTTIQRKIKFLAPLCDKFHRENLKKAQKIKGLEFMFDEMETFEQNHIHKIEIPVVVEKRSYFIVDMIPMDSSSRAQIPTKKKKYNEDHQDEFKKRPQNIKSVLSTCLEMKPKGKYTVYSDSRRGYSSYVTNIFGADCEHIEVLSNDESEKRTLFPVNNAMACMRAEKTMLRRRSWYFTKEKNSLSDHLKIYTFYYNYFRKKGYTVGHNVNGSKKVKFETPAQRLGISDKVIHIKSVVGF